MTYDRYQGAWRGWLKECASFRIYAPLPPLRPYAISISLRPTAEGGGEPPLSQESYAYFLDNMIFK